MSRDAFGTGARAAETHSLHAWRERHLHDPLRDVRPKRDRLLIGVLSGAVLFYLIGKALGLDRAR